VSEHVRQALVRHDQAIAFAIIVAIPVLLVLALTYFESRERIEAIDHHRAVVAYTTCLEQNERHDSTIRVVDKRLAGIVATGDIDRIAAAQESRDFTVQLIDALAPHQDCERISEDRFGEVPDREE
jgi:hypothetical protein